MKCCFKSVAVLPELYISIVNVFFEFDICSSFLQDDRHHDEIPAVASEALEANDLELSTLELCNELKMSLHTKELCMKASDT